MENNSNNNNEFHMPDEAGANEPVLGPVGPAPANASARTNSTSVRANRVSARANSVSARANGVPVRANGGGRKKHTRRHKKTKRTRRHRKH